MKTSPFFFRLLGSRSLYFSGLLWLMANAGLGQNLKAYEAAEFAKLNSEIKAGLFWQKDSAQRQLNERKILVSVIRQPRYWSFKGAGQVKASLKFAQSKITDFASLSRISQRFEDVEFDDKKSLLNLKVQFLGKIYAMEFLLSEEKGEDFYRLFYKSSSASAVAGVEGRLELLDAKQHLLISQIAVSENMPGWGPDWFLSLIAEGVMHHVAESTRKSIESNYTNNQFQ